MREKKAGPILSFLRSRVFLIQCLVEQEQRIAAVSVETLRLERARVAACFLFLSGMRTDAAATLPVSCVDIARREIHQLPELGVRTKNRKAAITYLLNIPELLKVVQDWDKIVQILPRNCLWYSPLTSDGMHLLPSAVPHTGRGDLLGRDLRLICARAGVTYLSPHKLRHGHVVYALKQARDMADLKAISQNVMHASVTITDQIYGQLINNDVGQIIGGLGTGNPLAGSEDKLDQLIEFLRNLKHPGLP